MADFMTELWNAVFEAGPTPTLLLATNVTFAALQLLLLALLVTTYSIHFVILSTLCAGLWVSINWFAAELKAVQNTQQQGPGDASVASATKESVESKDGPAYAVSQPAQPSGAAVQSGQDMRQRHMQQSVEGLDGDWEQVEGER